MTPEEFKRIKEAEKEHLRALKKLKQAVRGLERRAQMDKAIADIADSTEGLLDEHTAMVEKLAQETALQEARLELALESATEREAAEATGLSDEAALEQAEAETRRLRAKDLVDQVKLQLGGAGMDTPAERNRETKTSDEEASTTDTDGRSEQEASIPDKTIGRMRRK